MRAKSVNADKRQNGAGFVTHYGKLIQPEQGPMNNEDRFRRWLVASAPSRAADPLGYQARFMHGLVVQARLREPKEVQPSGNVVKIKGRRHVG